MSTHKRYQGIDVSRWEGRIHFNRVRKAGIRLVYIKASEGTNQIDPYFERNYSGAHREGLAIGFYHYVLARTVSEAEAEARFFASNIREKSQRVRPAMDFEEFGDLTQEEVREIALRFLTTLEAESGHKPVIYSNSSNASTRFNDDRFREYPLWIAEYDVSRPNMENPWINWSGWQYTDEGEVDGIHGNVDRDHFRRSILLEKAVEPCHENSEVEGE